jgi:hypothetical protein
MHHSPIVADRGLRVKMIGLGMVGLAAEVGVHQARTVRM